ncbi:hypothetical protein FRC12_003913 [Ceratobasidium sp. 428]|nr:hypothetical protein FRC12_003913 [Ceratobasidium sp. 428]
MSESQTRKVSGRIRRPSERLTNYDKEGHGRLDSLSKSVGRHETPPTAEELAAQAAQQLRERGKKQAKVAAARGNASQPGPLKPLQRQRDEDDDDEEEDDNDDPEAGPALLDYRLEELEYEGDRIEWLYQAIRKLGIRTNYRDDPDFQAEGPLSKEWKRLVLEASLGSAPATNQDHRIKTGLTHVLKPSTTGHSSRVQLVRTDSQTVGLDGKNVDAYDHREHGRPAPPKLARTDKTTITLDGKVVSPPRVAGLSGTKKRPSDGNPSPPKKRAVVPLVRIQELRKENRAHAGKGATSGPAASSKPAPNPPRPLSDDEEMADPPNDNPEQPLRPARNNGLGGNGLGGHDGEGGNEGEGGIGGEAGEGATGPDGEGDTDQEGVAAAAGGDDDEGPGGYDRLTRRQRSQLRAFSADARGLVEFTAERVKVKMATICAFPEVMTRDAADNQTYLERWLVGIWHKANLELRDGLPHLPFKDEYGTYIRNLIPAIRNGVKRSCDNLVPVYFKLRWSDPDRAAKARDLTDEGDERWTSPTLENDNDRFKHPIIRDTIENAFFKNKNSFGNKNLEAFTPLVPVPTIAYSCSIIRNRIKAYEGDKDKTADLNSASDADAFAMYMKMLEKIHKENPAHLLDAQGLITEQYIESQPEVTPVRVPEMEFGPDRDINMGPLERIKARLGDRVPDIKDWAAVKEIQDKGKGKGRAG